MSDFKRLNCFPLQDINLVIDFEMEEYNRNIFLHKPKYFDFEIDHDLLDLKLIHESHIGI